MNLTYKIASQIHSISNEKTHGNADDKTFITKRCISWIWQTNYTDIYSVSPIFISVRNWAINNIRFVRKSFVVDMWFIDRSCKVWKEGRALMVKLPWIIPCPGREFINSSHSLWIFERLYRFMWCGLIQTYLFHDYVPSIL